MAASMSWMHRNLTMLKDKIPNSEVIQAFDQCAESKFLVCNTRCEYDITMVIECSRFGGFCRFGTVKMSAFCCRSLHNGGEKKSMYLCMDTQHPASHSSASSPSHSITPNTLQQINRSKQSTLRHKPLHTNSPHIYSRSSFCQHGISNSIAPGQT